MTWALPAADFVWPWAPGLGLKRCHLGQVLIQQGVSIKQQGLSPDDAGAAHEGAFDAQFL